MIREILEESEIRNSVKVLRDSYTSVAEEFNLTEENCPSNTAFITFEKLDVLKAKGVRFFGLFIEDRQVGFVAVEKASETLYYLEKLAVLPGYRHHGYGKILMDFVFDYVKKLKGEKVSIGIINEHTILKNWYKDYGFIETCIKQFKHLPFTVCFMEKVVG